MTILEAMSCGLPVVASAVGGNPELVGNSNGALFTLGNGDGLQRIITDLLRDGALRTRLGIKSRERIEGGFSIEKTVKRYEEVYRCLYEKHKNS
jgi:glycosyltransferase involved in cell wall biosynthesis